MSGLDPLAALAAQVVAGADAAMEQATLDLGAVAAEIRAQVNVGDVVVATVLPAQDGSDRISFLGQTVNAQLPPGINPGESLALQVTGFTNTAILVQNLGVADPENPPQAVEFQPPSAASNAQSAVLSTTQQPTQSTSAQSSPTQSSPIQSAPVQTASTLVPSPTGAPLAPPPSVFVAASIRESIPPPATGEITLNAAPPGDLDTRIAVTRAGPGPIPVRPAPPSPAAPVTSRPSGAQRPAPQVPTPTAGSGAKSAPPATNLRISVPPIITQRGAPKGLDIDPEMTPVSQPRTPTAPADAPQVTLLRNLRVPVTPATIEAARGIGNAAQSVTSTFQKLEQLLAGVTQDDRTAALRSMLSFVSRIDLRNVRAMPEQIASFVSNVVDGAEAKIAQIVRAWSEANPPANENELPPATPPTATTSQPATATSTQTSAAPLPAPQAAAAIPVAVEAHVAERMVALDHDVKTAILALIENPPNGATPQVLTALRQALTATNSLQLNVLAGKTNDASVVTIPLPAYFYEGGKPAQIQISRDAPHGKNAMDADNFHVAFILDTKSLGTVAIDLQAVGRSLTIDVKTQATNFADRFRGTFNDLRSRFEQLHYRVAAIGAGVAPGTAAASAPPPERAAESNSSKLDMRA